MAAGALGRVPTRIYSGVSNRGASRGERPGTTGPRRWIPWTSGRSRTSGDRGLGATCARSSRVFRAAETDCYLESRWAAPSPAGRRRARASLLRPPRAITVCGAPPFCARRRIDVFHSTFYALPLFGGMGRWVLTVDLIPVVLAGAAGPKSGDLPEIYESARAADAVIVPARTRGDLCA